VGLQLFRPSQPPGLGSRYACRMLHVWQVIFTSLGLSSPETAGLRMPRGSVAQAEDLSLEHRSFNRRAIRALATHQLPKLKTRQGISPGGPPLRSFSVGLSACL
jgi:hypothetical protein